MLLPHPAITCLTGFPPSNSVQPTWPYSWSSNTPSLDLPQGLYSLFFFPVTPFPQVFPYSLSDIIQVSAPISPAPIVLPWLSFANIPFPLSSPLTLNNLPYSISHSLLLHHMLIYYLFIACLSALDLCASLVLCCVSSSCNIAHLMAGAQ